VLVQARHSYAAGCPDAWQPVGETMFASATARLAASGKAARFGIVSAIVPYADLMLGDAVRPVLDAHLVAGGGRVRGIRHILAWDADPALLNPAYPTSEDMMDSAAFRAGFRHLAPLGLSFDAWVLFPQLPRLARLARAFPDTAIVVNHCGGPLVGGSRAGTEKEVFARWKTGMEALADCPNVMVKLSGLGMPLAGFGFDAGRGPAASADLAMAWQPWMESCIAMFGADRAMFASNFPADRPSYNYRTGWNAMKCVAAAASDDEKDTLFSRSAMRFYRLGPDIEENREDQ
jgi:predicted TIM-barrel fold metal-dependent hydrolase